MTTNADYKYAKDMFNNHVAQHRCKALKLAEADGSEPCKIRVMLFKQMIAVAYALGR